MKNKKNKILTKEQVEKVVYDKTSISKILNIETGEAVTEEEAKLLPEDKVVKVLYNEVIKDRITKYLPMLLSMRGVKDVDSVDANDFEVKKLMRSWTKRQTKRFITDKEKSTQTSIYIESVKREHRPQYFTAMLQLFSWAILRDDVFKIRKGSIETKFEIEVPEDYWETDIEISDEDANLDSLIGDFHAPKLKFDKDSPLEFMLAIITEFLNQNDKLSDELQNVFTHISVSLKVLGGNREFDDIGFLNATLDDLLQQEDDDGSDIDE